MTQKDDVVYVVHPITAEQKRSYRKQGLKIIDAKFAPKGAKVENPNAKPAAAKK